MIKCMTCGALCAVVQHNFREGIVSQPPGLQAPRQRQWSYWAPLYHFRIDGSVIPLCSPACATLAKLNSASR